MTYEDDDEWLKMKFKNEFGLNPQKVPLLFEEWKFEERKKRKKNF